MLINEINMHKLLIIGASSGIGLQACKTALSQGHYVVAFSRHADQIQIHNDRLIKVSGDALNYTDVEQAMQGVDVVLQTLGVAMNLKLITGPITLFSEATEIMLSAMSKLKVNRLLAITGFGAGDSISAINPLQKIGFNMVFGRAYADKDIQERMIKASNINWTIIRPGVLTNCKSTSNYRILLKADEWKNGMISRTSVADFLVNNIDNEDMFLQSPVLIK